MSVTAYKYEDWLKDLEAVPEEERNEFVHESLRGKHMLHIFGRYFFPEEIPEGQETPELHLDIHRELAVPGNSAIIVPRGHAKTTWARIDIIHDIVYKHDDFIVLIGSTMEDAKLSYSHIKHNLESNDLLRQVYGNLVPDINPFRRRKWADRHFETENGVICIARGAGKGRGLNIKGKRPKKILIDDLEDDQSVKSKKARQRMEAWLKRVVIPSLDRTRGRVKMIGTVLHYDCLVLKMYKQWGGIKRAAIENDKGEPDMNGKPLFFSMEELLEKKKEMGSFGFAQEYMNEPASDENSDIKLDWIRRVDSVRLYNEDGTQNGKVYSVLDPNIKEKETADDAAIVTILRQEIDGMKKYYVMRVEHGKWGENKSIEMSQKVWNAYTHEKFGVEVVAFSELYKTRLNNAYMHAVGVSPKSNDKRTRLLRHSGLIETGDVLFMPGTEDLIDQLIQFPNGQNDDMVDAFSYAMELARGSGSSASVTVL